MYIYISALLIGAGITYSMVILRLSLLCIYVLRLSRVQIPLCHSLSTHRFYLTFREL